MCQPPVLSPQGGASCTLAHPGRVPSSNALSMVSTPTKERKPISFQNTPTPGGPGASPGMATHPKMRSMGLMAYFVAASKPESQPQQSYGTAKSLEHEYPIQFMAALANSLQRIAEACLALPFGRILSCVGLACSDIACVTGAGMSEYWCQDTRQHQCTDQGAASGKRCAGVASSSGIDARSEGCTCGSMYSS